MPRPCRATPRARPRPAAFRKGFEDADSGTTAPDPAHLALAHFVYGITLRAVGEESQAAEHLAQAQEIRTAYHLQGRDQVAPAAERELTQALDRILAPSR